MMGTGDQPFRSETIVNIPKVPTDPAGSIDINNAPDVFLPAVIQVPDNAIFTLQISGDDIDGDQLTYRFGTRDEFISAGTSSGTAVVAPLGATLTSSGLFTWDVRDSARAVNVSDQFVLTVMVEDGQTKTPIDVVLQIAPANTSVNSAPVFNLSTNQLIQLGGSIHTAVVATDVDNNLVSIRAVNPPSGMVTNYHSGSWRASH
jgi:hypothetical protein